MTYLRSSSTRWLFTMASRVFINNADPQDCSENSQPDNLFPGNYVTCRCCNGIDLSERVPQSVKCDNVFTENTAGSYVCKYRTVTVPLSGLV